MRGNALVAKFLALNLTCQNLGFSTQPKEAQKNIGLEGTDHGRRRDVTESEKKDVAGCGART